MSSTEPPSPVSPPSLEQFADLESAARRSLEAWDLEVASLTLRSQSENTVFELRTAAGGRFAVRVHRVGYNTIEELRSEQQWVLALRSVGFAVPRPVMTAEGEGYIEVALEDGTSRQVGVIEWCEGESLDQVIRSDADGTATQLSFRRLGEVMARLHNHAETWERPAGFTRRRWDADGLFGDSAEWGPFWLVPGLDAAGRDLMNRVRHRLAAEFTEFGHGADRFGLIHADLHPDNLLAGPSDLVVLDFDDCGFGWHLQDVAVALFDLRRGPDFVSARDALVAGYRRWRPLPDEHLARLSSFVMVRGLSLLGWLAARPEVIGARVLAQELAVSLVAVEEYLDKPEGACGPG